MIFHPDNARRLHGVFLFQIFLDLVIALLIALYVDSRGSGVGRFFAAFILVQLGILLVWARDSIGAWLAYIFLRDSEVVRLVSALVDGKFPMPDAGDIDSESYFSRVSGTAAFPAELRHRATLLWAEYGTLRKYGLKQELLRLKFIHERALLVYRMKRLVV